MKVCFGFFYDILVYSETWQAHLQHLHLVLSVLWQQHLYVKLSKCEFGVDQIEYLGHVISAKGVAMDCKKVDCMLSWPVPKNIKELRGFLRLIGYYRRFIQAYGSIAQPLTDLLKKGNYHWNSKA